MRNSNRLTPQPDSKVGTLGIGAVSRATGVQIVTLRYYESLGLIPRAVQAKAKHRRYREDVIAQVQLIRAGRDVGLSLDEIRCMVRLMRGFRTPALQLMRDLRGNIDAIEARIRGLEVIRQMLRSVLEDPTPKARE